MDYVPPPCHRSRDGQHVWMDDLDVHELRPLWTCFLCGFYVDRHAAEGTRPGGDAPG